MLSSPVLPELCSAGASLNPDLISTFLRRWSSLPVRPVVMEHVLQRSSTVARHRGGFHQLAPVTGGKPLTTSAGVSLPAFPSLSNPVKSIRLSIYPSIHVHIYLQRLLHFVLFIISVPFNIYFFLFQFSFRLQLQYCCDLSHSHPLAHLTHTCLHIEWGKMTEPTFSLFCSTSVCWTWNETTTQKCRWALKVFWGLISTPAEQILWPFQELNPLPG